VRRTLHSHKLIKSCRILPGGGDILLNMTANDVDLLRQYAAGKSEDAFTALVNRHLNLVYSAALRQVRSAQLAEEVAQSVFSDLARSATKLKPDTILTAWLYEIARRTAIDLVRKESRRQLRERAALEMIAMNSTASDWRQVEPLLDEAMDALEATDRAVILLRYFENQSLREVGQTLGTTDDAAQKRVSRAVERLREFFANRGVSVGAGGLAAIISANAVQAAPAGLAAAISSAAALAALGISASGGVGGTTGIFGMLLQACRSKLAAGLAATVLVGAVTFWLIGPQHGPGRGGVSKPRQITSADADQSQQAVAPGNQDAAVGDEQRHPDPLKLLQGVAGARRRIDSGSMDLQLLTDRFGNGHKETAQSRITVLFDGSKLRFETRRREYAYIPLVGDDSVEAKESIRQADSMEKEAAVRAGLLTASEAHEITACDGATVVRYRGHDSGGGSATVADPAKGGTEGAAYFFDPRCLGLRPSLYFSGTIEECLGYGSAASIDLVGQEPIEGLAAWHVQVQSKYGGILDFWIDVAQPTHLLKESEGKDFVVSKYDVINSRDPIPIEVNAMNSDKNGSPEFGKRFVRSKAEFNVSVDPASFTLAGLGMAVGTLVHDARGNRFLGFWNGAGLEESGVDPRTAPQTGPKMADVLDLLEYHAASPEGLQAAAWILLNTPDGPEVEKAAEVIQREHTGDTNLVYLCKELGWVRHRCSRGLLEAMLKNNPSADVRGTACFSLARMLKDECKYGENKKVTSEAEKQFERVIAEFGQVKQRGYPLKELAQPELDELRRLTIGNVAPEIEGQDLDGRPMKLSSYRGKVVVITFWPSVYTEATEHRRLVERMAGKPFAFIGVYGYDDLTRAKTDIEKYGITWPSFWDKRDGPITRNWNVHSWPSVWVLDRQGVIRYRDVRWGDLDKAVDTLLRE
jgi:RNA polymerase sigma factor (sigma-70 family)